jgi:hypothetical protein
LDWVFQQAQIAVEMIEYVLSLAENTLTMLISRLESPTSPRQALSGCCMPQRAGEGSGARQKPKTNLETNEFASNLPFKKKELAGVLSQYNFRRERWI